MKKDKLVALRLEAPILNLLEKRILKDNSNKSDFIKEAICQKLGIKYIPAYIEINGKKIKG